MADHLLDEIGPVVHAVGGEGGEGPGHVDGQDLVGPQRHGEVGGDGGGDAQARRRLGHLGQSDQLAQADVGAVHRAAGGFAEAEHATGGTLEVLQLVGVGDAAGVGEGARPPSVDRGGGRDALLQGGGQHEGLERRARLLALPLGGDVVLVGLEAPAAHQGPHRAGPRLHADHRGGELPIRVGDGGGHRLLGQRLEPGIERRLDRQPAEEQGVVAIGLGLTQAGIPQQALGDLLDEVVLGLGQQLEVGRLTWYRYLAHLLGAGGVELAHGHQAVEHQVAPLGGHVGIAEGVVADGVADQPGEEGGLALGQLAGAHPEVELGCCLHPVGAVAEVDRVEVALEDLVLGHLVLEAGGQHRFLELALEILLGREQGVLHQLLGDGGAALEHVAGGDVGRQGPGGRPQVDAGVVVEGLVLDREHGVDHHLGDLRQRHRLAVLLPVQHGDQAAVGGQDHRPLGQGVEVELAGGCRRSGLQHPCGGLGQEGQAQRTQTPDQGDYPEEAPDAIEGLVARLACPPVHAHDHANASGKRSPGCVTLTPRFGV